MQVNCSEVEQKQSEKIKRPALLIQSTEELLRQLPKGESLLEEAEVAISMNRKFESTENTEELLRSTVDSMHLRQIQRMEAPYIKNLDDMNREIEHYQQENTKLEQKIRKFSLQANSEHEELEEIRDHTEMVNDLENTREEIFKEILFMEETIAILQKDINEAFNSSKDQQEKLVSEIAEYKEKVTQIDNQRVDNLEYECKDLYKENQKIAQDIEKIEQLWKGDHNEAMKIVKELDENSNALRKEARDIVVSRSVIAQKRETIRNAMKELEITRLEHLRSSTAPIEKNPRNLYIYLDNILTDVSRRIRLVMQGKFKDSKLENVVKEQLGSAVLGSTQSR